MDYQNEIEQELIFQVEAKNKDEKKSGKKKKVIKLAEENLIKMVMDKLGGKTGEC